MIKLAYCQKCILPNTRPNLNFHTDGVCEPCKSATAEKKLDIDWVKREADFKALAQAAKAKNASYDCLIPVSGGKDSTWQVIKAHEYGLRPLAVTWKTPARNSLGQKNLDNLISLGVDHIDFSINPKVERLFTLKALKKLGSPVIPMHMALHAIPLQIAIRFQIPLLLQGENSAFEYGSDDSLKGFTLTNAYLKKYGVTNGTTYEDWIDEDLSREDLIPYQWPTDKEISNSGLKAIFLGHFFSWDPLDTFKIASEHGFEADEKPLTGLYEFADIDDAFLITIHHWLKWYKFGFTRLWDNLSLEIRNNRMTRDEAIEIVRKKGPEYPEKEIELFCEYTEITLKQFQDIVDKFRNEEIWKKDEYGNWFINNFLINEWSWNSSMGAGNEDLRKTTT